jgi:hypothetical protein
MLHHSIEISIFLLPFHDFLLILKDFLLLLKDFLLTLKDFLLLLKDFLLTLKDLGQEQFDGIEYICVLQLIINDFEFVSF